LDPWIQIEKKRKRGLISSSAAAAHPSSVFPRSPPSEQPDLPTPPSLLVFLVPPFGRLAFRHLISLSLPLPFLCCRGGGGEERGEGCTRKEDLEEGQREQSSCWRSSLPSLLAPIPGAINPALPAATGSHVALLPCSQCFQASEEDHLGGIGRAQDPL